MLSRQYFRRALLAAAFCSIFVPAAAATDVMCDPSYQDCRAMLLSRIENETVAIDLAMLFMEDDALIEAILARHHAGVRVRMLVEPRRNSATPKNEETLARFRAAGIPMRAKSGGGMLHWKFMLFDAQNVIQFSAANYSDYYFRPIVPYVNYTDEGIYFTDQASLVDSFRRTFDDAWIDSAAFVDFGNITAAPVRRYPLYAIDPDLSFVPAENFATRSVPLYDAEQQRIDTVMYKITETKHADGLIRAARRGVPVRVITEPERYRNRSNVWQAYHIDRLYMAGVEIRDSAHEGFLHQKSTLLYGQALTIFGSSNWTSESNSSQYEHNYFTDKAWFFTWFRENFERKWFNRTGHVETVPFVPLPPTAPSYLAPAANATGVATAGAVLRWNPGPWSWGADVYFGTSPSPPLYQANVSVSANSTKTFTLPALASGTTYYWRIVSRTVAQQTESGAVYAFTTAGGSAPPPNALPSVSLTAPSNNSTFTAPATIALAASASDSDGTIARVEFYSGSTLLGTDTSSPYQFTWSSVPAGTYSLTARATDDDGGTATSSAAAITVTSAAPPPNAAPTVALTSPANNSTFTAPATIALAASASDSDGTIARVEFYSGSTLLGSDASSPYQFTWSSVPAGSYSLTARATDDDGATRTSSAISITVGTPTTALPPPWETRDIGAAGPAGRASVSNGTYAVSGGGADIWGSADAFHYVWQPMSGDVDVIARVASVENVHAWTKAGVMIREQLTAGSPHALMLVSPGKGMAFQRRIAAGGLSTNTSGRISTAPAWVKLERRASTITAFSSADGATWTLVGRETFTMGLTVYVGLAVSSHDATRLASATFDNVVVRAPTVTPDPPPADAREIVLHAADATALAGTWRLEADATAAGGRRAWNPDAGAAKISAAAAAPASFVELTFTAEAGRPYRLWIRGKADRDYWGNDSAYVQFSGAITAQGAAAYRIGTTASTQFNLESCSGCGLGGWGWEDNGWGTNVLGPVIYFATTGTQRIRVQAREDGLSFDQVVLSSERYLTTAPGPTKYDTTILQRQ